MIEFDKDVKLYFDKKIKQVFVYITSRCQLNCRQCLYKTLLDNSSIDIDYNILKNLLISFHKMAAYKISFLGGEPTLYKDKVNEKDFTDVIKLSKDIGFTYIRIDTNGQFNKSLLDHKCIKLLDEITFSLDGHNAKINDIVRGLGTFDKCIENIKYAVKEGYKVQITSCVHKDSCPNEETGTRNIKAIINLAEDLKIYAINFHPIIKVGVKRDTWIDDTNITFKEWLKIYENIIKLKSEFKVHIRIPVRVETKENIKSNYDKYFYCPLKMGERALIMPDGQIKVCAFTIGTNECIARYTNETVVFDKNNNELNNIKKLDNEEVCYNQKSNLENLVPLCMSYKPNQKEIVWNDINKNSN